MQKTNNMSIEEDIELKYLIAQTLNSNGTLAKIKAQLRASVFLALDEDEKISQQKPMLNPKVKQFMESEEGKTMFYIVHEFLEYFNLCFTLSVYEPESYVDCKYEVEKQKLLQQFGLVSDHNEPILYKLLKLAQVSKRNGASNSTPNQSINTEINISRVSENSLENSYNKSGDVNYKVSPAFLNLNETYVTHTPKLLKKVKLADRKISNNDLATEITNSKQSNNTYEDTSSIVDDLVPENGNKVPDVKINGISNDIKDKPKLSPTKSDKLLKIAQRSKSNGPLNSSPKQSLNNEPTSTSVSDICSDYVNNKSGEIIDIHLNPKMNISEASKFFKNGKKPEKKTHLKQNDDTYEDTSSLVDDLVNDNIPDVKLNGNGDDIIKDKLSSKSD